MNEDKSERIAKVIARSGYCSRRAAEELIMQRLVKVNGHLIETPATLVTAKDEITIKGEKLEKPQKTGLWKFYKPKGVLTSSTDPMGRKTIQDILGSEFTHIITIGRLDYNSEGLLLITNDGEFARFLEHPSSQIKRTYKVRVRGKVDPEKLHALQKGITIEGVKYLGVDAEIIEQSSSNAWVKMTLQEGKNREIRNIMEHLGYPVNRLIRVSFGAFDLGALKVGTVETIPDSFVQKHCKAFFKK